MAHDCPIIEWAFGIEYCGMNASHTGDELSLTHRHAAFGSGVKVARPRNYLSEDQALSSRNWHQPGASNVNSEQW